jgi:hypothetical protein
MKECEWKQVSDLGLRLYEQSEDDGTIWMVTGMSKREGRRWRRRFPTKEKAELFLVREVRRLRAGESGSGGRESHEDIEGAIVRGCEQEGGDDRASSDERSGIRGAEFGKAMGRRLRRGKRRTNGNIRMIVAAVLVALGAYGVDRQFRGFLGPGVSGAVLESDFEVNPVLAGWKGKGDQVGWGEGTSAGGRGTLVVRQGEWVSPEAPAEPLQWYRMSFRSKVAEASQESAGKSELECAVNFRSERAEGHRSIVMPLLRPHDGWEKSEFRFRGYPFPDALGNFRPAFMQVRFYSEEAVAVCVDDVRVEEATVTEVGIWADRFYAQLPSRLSYRGKETRWKRLTGTMERLRNHQRLRIVFIGDDVVESLARVPVDIFLQRLYPGSVVEIVPMTEVVSEFGRISETIVKALVGLRPDLLIVGGVSNNDDFPALQMIVDQVRANNAAGRRRAEILLLSKGWKSGGQDAEEMRFTSDMRELDQEVERNAAVPDDIRGRLLRFAAANEVEFLDVMGVVSEFIFGPAAHASEGRQTGPDGVPYTFRKRDWLPGDESGWHLVGRILEAYFSPTGDGAAIARAMGGDGESKPIRVFDPQRSAEDRATSAAVKLEFGVSAVERPALAARLGGERMQGEQRRGAGIAAFRVSGQSMREVGYVFDEPLDVRLGDVTVYWSFRSDRNAGEDLGKLTMHLAFTDPTAGGREDRSQVSLTVRPGSASILGVGGGAKASSEVEHLLEVPVENFIDPVRVAKFRLLLRWVGGERMLAEAASWNPRSNRWEGFIPFDRPGAPTFAMELSTARDLLGTSSFKSIHFEAQSGVPELESVLVTMRPSMIR